jgi:WD40 repeat protein
MWHFDQHQNRSLNQWVLEPDLPLKEANPKKSAVKKINFSNYGDKFVSLNAEGTLFLHSFDLRGDGGTLYVHKGHKITDFGLMDPDCTVIAALSSSTKTLSIIDCMTGDILVQSKTVGNMLQVDAERQCLYTFNSKSGAIQQHDCNL